MILNEAERIPGWMSRGDLTILGEIARRVPRGGTIVEVGPFLGRSTYILAKSCDPSVTVHVVDPWSWLPSNYDAEKPGGPIDPKRNAQELFDQYTVLCPNVVKHKGFSPKAHPPIPAGGFDFVFIDGDHRSPEFDNDVRFYYERLAIGGALMGDDYSPSWQNIREFLDRFSAEKNLLITPKGEKLWELAPKTEQVSLRR